LRANSEQTNEQENPDWKQHDEVKGYKKDENKIRELESKCQKYEMKCKSLSIENESLQFSRQEDHQTLQQIHDELQTYKEKYRNIEKENSDLNLILEQYTEGTEKLHLQEYAKLSGEIECMKKQLAEKDRIIEQMRCDHIEKEKRIEELELQMQNFVALESQNKLHEQTSVADPPEINESIKEQVSCEQKDETSKSEDRNLIGEDFRKQLDNNKTLTKDAKFQAKNLLIKGHNDTEHLKPSDATYSLEVDKLFIDSVKSSKAFVTTRYVQHINL
jgi:hypothetical protein